MTNVQTKLFQGTIGDARPAAVHALVETVWTECNAWLLTQDYNDICDVRGSLHSMTGKYGTSIIMHYQVTVFFLSHGV